MGTAQVVYSGSHSTCFTASGSNPIWANFTIFHTAHDSHRASWSRESRNNSLSATRNTPGGQ